jgi:hypothetical protein
VSVLSDRWREHLRLSTLRVLAEAPGYAANDSLITDVLRDDLGFGVTRDQVRTELDWLAEQGLAIVTSTAGIRIATATGRGTDVALGHATVSGVKRPSPKG